MTEKIQVPNFQATAERKKIYTLKQWLERFRHNTKRKHKIDIAEVIRGAEMTQTGWQNKLKYKKTSFGASNRKHYTIMNYKYARLVSERFIVTYFATEVS